MKTPRQILFERHHSALGKLDRIRAKTLSNEWSGVREERRRDARHPAAAVLRKLWHELIWPCRRAWAGFVVVWIALLMVHLVTSTDPKNDKPTPSSAEIVAAFEQRRQLLAELLRPPSPDPAELPPKHPPEARARRNRNDWAV